MNNFQKYWKEGLMRHAVYLHLALFLGVLFSGFTEEFDPVPVANSTFCAETSGEDSILDDNGTEYCVHIFTDTGIHNFTLPGGISEVDVLVVAGGGGGGGAGGGGGGAGGLLFESGFSASGSVEVEVGGGGSAGSDGEDSRFVGGSTLTAVGGGAGGSSGGTGNSGGSGGGGSGQNSGGGSGEAGQGNDGGVGARHGQDNTGGGGGGAASAGTNAGNQGGDGGEGINEFNGQIFTELFGVGIGDNGYFSGGGAGGDRQNNGGTGGVGGGGDGAQGSESGSNAIDGTGGGGGGGGSDSGVSDGGSGGSGIVIVRYEVPDDVPVLDTINPGDEATQVAVNTDVWAEFEEPIEEGPEFGNITLTDSEDQQVSGLSTDIVSGNRVELTYSGDLENAEEYTVTIPSGAVESSGGTPNPSDIVWSFTTIMAAPEVTELIPEDEANEVAVNTTVRAIFDQDLSQGTEFGQITMVDSEDEEVGGLSASISSGNRVNITYDGDLEHNETYTVTIPADAVENDDEVGNAEVTWSFTTSGEPPPPIVTTFTPDEDETGVAVNTQVSAEWNETVSQAGSFSGITMRDSQDQEVDGLTVDLQGGTVIEITYSGDLDHEETYTVTIPEGAVENSNNVGNQEISWNFTTTMAAPSVVTLTPDDNDTDVSVFAIISAEFDQDITGEDLGSITLEDEGGSPVSGVSASIAGDNRTVEITYNGQLAAQEEHTVVIPAGAVVNSEEIGNETVSWSFTTGDAPITADLRLQYLNASTDAESGQIRPHMRIYNDGEEPVDISEITIRYWFESEPEGDDVYECYFASVGCGNVTHQFDVEQSFHFIEWGFTEGAGGLSDGEVIVMDNHEIVADPWGLYDQTNDYSWDPSFTEFANYERIAVYYQGTLIWGTPPAGPPEVISLTPESGTTGVAWNTEVKAEFDQDLVEIDLSGVTFEDSGGNPVSDASASITGDRTIEITYSGDLAFAEEYTVTIPAGAVENQDGGAISEVSWSFTTAVETPGIVSLTPEDNAERVAIDTDIQAEFDQDVTAEDLSEITLEDSGGSPVDNVSALLASDNRTIEISYSGDLDHGEEYTVIIPEGSVKNVDDVGNNEVFWSFTTILAAPEVTELIPEDEANEVAVNTTVRAIFDQDLSQGTEFGQITMVDSGNEEVDGFSASIGSGNRVNITYDGDLEHNETYTVTIPADAVENDDEVGNTEVTWSFTTSGEPPPPIVTTFTPDEDETGVAVNTQVSAEWNETVSQAGSFSGITMRDSQDQEVDGLTVDLLGGTVIEITYSGDLEHGETYTITIPEGAVENSNNIVNDEIAWNFTVIRTHPEIVKVTPADEATNVFIGTSVSAEFDQQISEGPAFSSVTMEDGDGIQVDGFEAHIVNQSIIQISYDGTLNNEETYTVTIPEDAVVNPDDLGNIGTFTWSFTTVDEPAVSGEVSFINLSQSTGNASSITLDTPAGTEAGDLLVVFIGIRAGAVTIHNPPSGWQQIGSLEQQSDLITGAYYRAADEGDASGNSYTWTTQSGDIFIASMTTFRNANVSDPIHKFGVQHGSGDPVTAPSVETDIQNTLMLGLYSAVDARSELTVNDLENQLFVETTGSGPNGIGVSFGAETFGATGETGSKTASGVRENNNNIGWMVAISPELNIQRELTGDPGYRMIAAPVSATYAELLNNFSEVRVDGNDNQPNLLWFDETFDGTAPTANASWRTPSSLNDPVQAGRGYFFYVFDSDLPGTLEADGGAHPFPDGEFEFNVTYTDNRGEGFEHLQGWNLVGNPGTRTIDWDDADHWTRNNIGDTFYIWDPESEEFLVWNGTTGNNPNQGLIAPFQGFWVKADENPEMIMETGAFSSGAGFVGDQSTARRDGVVTVDMSLEASEMSSSAFLSFRDGGKVGKDSYDGFRLQPMNNRSYLTFFTTSGDKEDPPLVINTLPRNLDERIRVPLQVGGLLDGEPIQDEFTLKWIIPHNWPNRWSITLMDHHKQEAIPMNRVYSYTFGHQTSAEIVSKELEEYWDKLELLKMPDRIVSEERVMPAYLAEEKPAKMKTGSNVARFTLMIEPDDNPGDPDYIPNEPEMLSNYPNPFRDMTTLGFALDEEREVRLEVYDTVGRRVDTITEGVYPEGTHRFEWDASRFSSGVYIAYLRTGSYVISERMVIVK